MPERPALAGKSLAATNGLHGRVLCLPMANDLSNVELDTISSVLEGCLTRSVPLDGSGRHADDGLTVGHRPNHDGAGADGGFSAHLDVWDDDRP